jgi:hypothetical protein
VAESRTVVAVDWSGRASGAQRFIWRAAVRDGVVSLESGLDRAATIRAVIAERDRSDRFTVGFDFSFAFAAWFTRSLGCETVGELWALATAVGEEWIERCRPPFWGRPGTRRPSGFPLLRRTEDPACYHHHARPFSTFQIGGAGAVGTGSIRGMPHLAELERQGLGIWPFAPHGRCGVIEIYPRLFTGPVVKSDLAARTIALERFDWSNLEVPARARAAATGSPDAFDALISAVRLWARRDEIASLEPSTDAQTRLEGWVFGATPRTETSVPRARFPPP